jgi:hypothetical protein
MGAGTGLTGSHPVQRRVFKPSPAGNCSWRLGLGLDKDLVASDSRTARRALPPSGSRFGVIQTSMVNSDILSQR